MISKILEGTIDYLKLINKEDLCLEFEEKKKAYTKLEAIYGENKEGLVYIISLILTGIGMLCRYILEYGEVSNIRNFTKFNIVSFLIIVPIYIIIVYRYIIKKNMLKKNNQ